MFSPAYYAEWKYCAYIEKNKNCFEPKKHKKRSNKNWIQFCLAFINSRRISWVPLAQALVFSWLSLLSTSTSRSSLKNRVKWAVWVRCCFNKFFVLIYTKFITTSYVWCFIAMACTTVSKVGICIYHLTHFVFSSLLRRMKVLRIHRKKQKLFRTQKTQKTIQ